MKPKLRILLTACCASLISLHALKDCRAAAAPILGVRVDSSGVLTAPTNLFQTNAAALAAALAGRLAPAFTNAQGVYVDPNGGAGVRGVANLPAATVSNALAVAHSGDTVFVTPGIYTQNQLLTNGVNLQFAPGAAVNFVQQEGDPDGRGISDDRLSGASTNHIIFGDLVFTSYTNRVTNNVHARSANMLGAVVVTQNFSRLTLQGNRLGVAGIAGAGFPNDQLPAAVYQLTGTNSFIDIAINEIFDPFYDGMTISNITGIGTTKVKPSPASGLWWDNGAMFAHVHKLGPFYKTPAVYGLGINTTVTNEMYGTFDLVGGRVAMVLASTNYISWLDAKKIVAKDDPGNYAAYYVTGGRNYLTGQKLEGATDIWMFDDGLGNQQPFAWVRELKLAASLQWVNASKGNLWLDAQTYEDQGVTNGFLNNGAVLFIGAGDANVNAGRGFTHVSGTSTLDGLHINTSGTDQSTNNPVFVAGAGLKLHNAVLTAPASANAVEAASAQTVTIEGMLSANRAISANITFAGPTNHTVNASLHGPAVADHNLVFTSAGKGVQFKEGSNAKQGTAQLNGTSAVTISTTACVSTNSSRIWLTIQTPNGTVGSPYVSAVTAATSFQIKSTAVGDNSTVAWLITDSSN